MKKNVVLLILVLILLSSVQTFSAGQKDTEGVQTEEYTMKIGIKHPPTHTFTKALYKFEELAEARAGGRVKVEIIPNAQLGSDREMQEMVSLGTLEATESGIVVIYEPLFALLELPYLYRDRDHIKSVMNSALIKDLANSIVPKGIRLLTTYENGFRNITNSKRAINSPEDLKGLKIRTPENPAQLETFKALGALPTPLSFSELYSALQQGVMDGQENPLQNIWSAKLYEVQKHLAITGHIYNSTYIIVSEQWWQTVPSDLKQIIQEAATESSEYQMNLVKELDKSLINELEQKGMLITYPDKESFRKESASVYDVFYKKYGDRAKEIVEAIQKM